VGVINNAQAYAAWRKRLLTAPSAADSAAGAVMLDRAVIEILATDQFYGEVLTRLARMANSKLTTPFALVWQANRLNLQFSAQPMATIFTRFDELQAGLKHVALHVIWQHPLRYRQLAQRQPELVTLATDLAVNQYVTGLPPTSPQLATVQPLVSQPLPRCADSQVYLRLLQMQASTAEKSGVPKAANNHDAPPTPSTGTQPTPPIDAVKGWSAATGQLSNPNLATSRLQQLTQAAWDQTTAANRGLVAGQVQAQLARQRQAPALDWRRLLVRGLGQIVTDKQSSHARFNRRQPARMELPGQISQTQVQLKVYVDHSGSISDATLTGLLSQVATLVQAMPTTITVKAFDAIVHTGQTYQANFPQQIRFQRQGGGGTVYQSVFDDLQQQQATNQTTLALILTDGQGESTLDQHHFTNVIWLLAHADDHLSVQPVYGQVIHLKQRGSDDDPTT